MPTDHLTKLNIFIRLKMNTHANTKSSLLAVVLKGVHKYSFFLNLVSKFFDYIHQFLVSTHDKKKKNIEFINGFFLVHL